MADLIGGAQQVTGDTPHGSQDAGPPLKVANKAIDHGTDPAEVDADDRSDLYCDRQGMPFGMLGHPAVITREYMTTAVQTGDEIIGSIGATQRVVVVGCTITVSGSTTADPKIRVGFGTTGSVPAEPSSGSSVTGMVAVHAGAPGGGGVSEGTGGSRISVGGLGQELGIANDVPTGGQISVIVRYYVIDEV